MNITKKKKQKLCKRISHAYKKLAKEFIEDQANFLKAVVAVCIDGNPSNDEINEFINSYHDLVIKLSYRELIKHLNMNIADVQDDYLIIKFLTGELSLDDMSSRVDQDIAQLINNSNNYVNLFNDDINGGYQWQE